MGQMKEWTPTQEMRTAWNCLMEDQSEAIRCYNLGRECMKNAQHAAKIGEGWKVKHTFQTDTGTDEIKIGSGGGTIMCPGMPDPIETKVRTYRTYQVLIDWEGRHWECLVSCAQVDNSTGTASNKGLVQSAHIMFDKHITAYMTDGKRLPAEVREWIGMTTATPKFRYEPLTEAALNAHWGKVFGCPKQYPQWTNGQPTSDEVNAAIQDANTFVPDVDANQKKRLDDNLKGVFG